MTRDYTGQQLGKYRVLRLAEQNDCADVYIADTTPHSMEVTISVLRANLPKEGQSHFLAQAERLSQLKHPQILEVIDFGVQDPAFFLVTPINTYPSLRQVHPKGYRLPEELILDYVEQMSVVLQDAHAHGMIHGGIKPEFILQKEDNKLLLANFGFLPILMHANTKSAQGRNSVLNALNVPYLAPEQLQGEASSASDQYALGIVVYEWLCGDVPFGGTVTKVIRQHMQDSPPSLAKRVPGLSPYLEEVVVITLAKNPEERFRSVQAFTTALDNAIRHPPESLETEGTFRFPQRPYWLDIEKIKSQVVENSNMTTLMPQRGDSEKPASGIPTFIPSSSETGHSEKQASELADTTPEKPLPVKAQAAEQQSRPAISRRAIIGGLVGVGAVAGITATVLATRAITQPSASTTVIPSPTDQPLSRVLTPVSNAVLGSTITIFKGHTDQVFSVSWSPDTKFIASGSADTTVQVWEAVGNRTILNYQAHNDLVLTVAWAPDGTRIASGGRDTTVQVWDTKNGNTLFTYTHHPKQVNALDWSGDSKFIASVSNDDTLQVWNATHGTLVFQTNLKNIARTVAWSPNGKTIAAGGDDNNVTLYDATSGQLLASYTGHTSRVRALTWSPDSTRIASAGDDHIVHIWNTTTGQLMYSYTGHQHPVAAVSWSADASRIASSALETIHVWEVNTGQLVYTYKKHLLSVSTVNWSPKGPYIASGGVDQTVQVWKGM